MIFGQVWGKKETGRPYLQGLLVNLFKVPFAHVREVEIKHIAAFIYKIFPEQTLTRLDFGVGNADFWCIVALISLTVRFSVPSARTMLTSTLTLLSR